MQRIILVILFCSVCLSESYASCGSERQEEFDALGEELRNIDIDWFLEAREAYKIADMYDEFGKGVKDCRHIKRVLKDMRDMVDAIKK